MRMQWGDFHLTIAATPAGLLERPAADAQAELTVTLTQTSPFALAQSVIAGDKPGVEIQGDVQLAAEVAWLVDNVRWDLEEDLARVVGDVPAHAIGEAARRLAAGLRQMLGAAGAPGKASA